MTDDAIQAKVVGFLTQGSGTLVEIFGYLFDVPKPSIERNLRTLMSQGRVVGSLASLTSVFSLTGNEPHLPERRRMEIDEPRVEVEGRYPMDELEKYELSVDNVLAAGNVTSEENVTVTFGELLDAGVWESFCEAYGVNLYAMREGLASSSEEAEISLEQAAEWGVLSEANCPHDDIEWVYETHAVCRRCGGSRMADD